LGTFVLSSDYHNTYYAHAQKVRRLIRDRTIALLERHDILLMPTTPTTAFALGSKGSPLTMYLSDLFSVQANVAGVPALSIPYGKDAQHLPIGLQAMSNDFQEGKLLQFAKALQVDQ
jgi:aspartyl-tRNA(Asn)/glutamyl-tRNA(Gln) amidotransferase subunit A